LEKDREKAREKARKQREMAYHSTYLPPLGRNSTGTISKVLRVNPEQLEEAKSWGIVLDREHKAHPGILRLSTSTRENLRKHDNGVRHPIPRTRV
jgi:hypothetical protein